MNRKKRISYLVTTLCVLVTGFFLYGCIGSAEPLIGNSRMYSFLFYGCLGGFGFSVILSTVMLSANFFAKRGLAFQVVAAVLWPITIACCFYVGVLGYIPYQIYNVVKLITDKPQSDTVVD